MQEYQSLFQVRTAQYSDIESIMDITHEAFTEYSRMAGVDAVDALYETYSDVKNDIDTKLVLIAISDGVPLGTVRIAINDDNTAYLSRFAVRINNQNMGVGKSIMSLVDKIMIKKGVKRISLHTGSKITPLIRFYYGRGFYIESTESSKGYIRALLVKDYDRYIQKPKNPITAL